MGHPGSSFLRPFLRGEARTVLLVSGAHAFSHFYMLVLPPIFPLLHSDLNVSYTALGALLMVYAIATGVMQVPMGLLVDHVGGRAVLAGGLALNAVAISMLGIFPDYWLMILFMLLAGAGNSVFHPADYALLSARVGDGRIGRAFSMHLFAGYVGWMCAPPVVLALTSLVGWQNAMMILGVVGIGYAAGLLMQRGNLCDREQRDAVREVTRNAHESGMRTGLRLIFTPAIAILFVFYAIVAAAGNGMQGFSVVALVDLHEMSLERANLALTIYFVAAATGTLVGGYLADRVGRHDVATAIAFSLSALFVMLIGAQLVPSMMVLGLMYLAGFVFAAVGPMRDVMVRNASPRGQIGTAFGVVTTGFSVGLTLSPVLLGWIADLGRPEFVFWSTAMIMLAGILMLSVMGSSFRARHSPG